jgi:hypothetical protein
MLVVGYGRFFNCGTPEDGTKLDCFTLDDGTDMLSRNIDNKLPT